MAHQPQPTDQVDDPSNQYRIVHQIGAGAYGTVYRCVKNGEEEVPLAIKIIPMVTDMRDIIKELSMLRQCHCDNIVKYYDSYFEDESIVIVMEYCVGGSVADMMKALQRTCHESEMATILRDALTGLEYLHLRGRLHRDVKAANILLDASGISKLADLGVAGQLSNTMIKRNTWIGTPYWMAPEVAEEAEYDCLADIWSTGITAIEMADGVPPFSDHHPMRAIFMIPNSNPMPKIPSNFSKGFLDFLSFCLVKDPMKRWSATKLLLHRFILDAQPSVSLVPIVQSVIQLLQEERETEERGSTISKNEEDENNEENQNLTLKLDTLNGFDTKNGFDTCVSNASFNSVVENPTLKNDDDDDEAQTILAPFMQQFDASSLQTVQRRVQRFSLSTDDQEEDEEAGRNEGDEEEEDDINADAIFNKIRLGNYDFLDGLDVSQLHRRLDVVDQQLEERLERVGEIFNKRKEPILAAIRLKHTRNAEDEQTS